MGSKWEPGLWPAITPEQHPSPLRLKQSSWRRPLPQHPRDQHGAASGLDSAAPRAERASKRTHQVFHPKALGRPHLPTHPMEGQADTRITHPMEGQTDPPPTPTTHLHSARPHPPYAHSLRGPTAPTGSPTGRPRCPGTPPHPATRAPSLVRRQPPPGRPQPGRTPKKKQQQLSLF